VEIPHLATCSGDCINPHRSLVCHRHVGQKQAKANPRPELMLGQRANHLDLRIMNKGKILLLDLGRSDGETNRLIDSLVVTDLELVTL
jgi:hypothetical protein